MHGDSIPYDERGTAGFEILFHQRVFINHILYHTQHMSWMERFRDIQICSVIIGIDLVFNRVFGRNMNNRNMSCPFIRLQYIC